MEHPDLILGPVHGADAGVYRLRDDLAIVQSADFFPPHLEDPYAFGKVAAANALSDIYAMGARPVTALNLLATPPKVDEDASVSILNGGCEKCAEAGCIITGGHTITNPSIMYGLSVTGVVHPDELIVNTTPEAGDVLLLTKPIGTGIVIHAHATGDAGDELLGGCTELMAELNKAAGERLVKFHAHASTDVTGFGLIGHALDMLALQNVGYEIEYAKVPLHEEVHALAERGNIPAGSQANAKFTDCNVTYRGVPDVARTILNDAQTSGGLLVSLSADDAAGLMDAVRTTGYPLAMALIGRVVPEHPGKIIVS